MAYADSHSSGNLFMDCAAKLKWPVNTSKSSACDNVYHVMGRSDLEACVLLMTPGESRVSRCGCGSRAGGRGGGLCKLIFGIFFFLRLKELVFVLHVLHFFCIFFLLPSCLHFTLLVAIHQRVCVTCTILTVGGGGKCIYWHLHRIFCSLHLHPRPLSRGLEV